MSNSIVQPPGEKVARALKELCELLESKPEKTRAQLMQEVVIKHDLSPKESDFLQRNFKD